MNKKKPLVFLDFDGTLINISKRHYKVYKDLVKKFNGKPLSKAIYWKLKRNKIDWPKILEKSSLSPNKLSLFLKKFISKIESEENLFLDAIFPYTKKTFDSLCKNYYPLYLISLRHSRKNVIKQINKMGLKKYFKKILISSKRDKLIATIKNLTKGTSNSIIVGDTEEQTLIAKELGLISVVVLSGIRNRLFLMKYNPNFIIKNVGFLPSLLTKYE